MEELRIQDAEAQAEIKKCEEQINAEAFAMSTVSGGALAATARNACQTRMQAASARKSSIESGNAWVHEMLSKYR